MKALLSILCVLLYSCSAIPTPHGYAVMVGGKGAMNSQADGSVKFAYDNEDSFRRFTNAAVLAAGAYFSAAASEAEQVTARAVDSNATTKAIETTKATEATKQLQIQTDGAVKMAELASP